MITQKWELIFKHQNGEWYRAYGTYVGNIKVLFCTKEEPTICVAALEIDFLKAAEKWDKEQKMKNLLAVKKIL